MTILRHVLVLLTVSFLSLCVLPLPEATAARPIATDGDPVDLSTGLYILDETDFFLPDVIPITFIRTYRTLDSGARAFGIGTTHAYDLYLQRNDLCTEVRLILPDGGRIRYTRVSGKNCVDASLVHTSTPTKFYDSSLRWEAGEQKWVIRRKDGTIYRFTSGGLDRFMYPFMSLTEVEDGSGNILTIARDKLGRITSMTSPCGLWARFEYDQGNRVTKISDIGGRMITYEYDGAGHLLSVRYSDGQASRYTYDSAHHMLTVDDKSGMSFSHHYDANGRVIEQSYPDGTSYQFRYAIDDTGKSRITLVRNRLGHLRIVIFNDARYTVRDTRNVGRPEEHTKTYEWEEGTNRLLQTLEFGASTSYGGDVGERNEDSGETGSSTPKTILPSTPGPSKSDDTDKGGELTSSSHRTPLALCRTVKALSSTRAEKSLTHDEIDKMWGELIRDEQYEIIQFLDKQSADPTRHAQSLDKTILLEDRREGYLWGLFAGGGWGIESRLEAELPVEGGIWQLYSKTVTKWFPGFANLLKPRYKDQIWEFDLILRDALNRQKITQLKTVTVSASDILKGSAAGQSNSETTPQARLRYDESRGVVMILISKIKKPLEVEVPVISSFSLVPSLNRDGQTTGAPTSLNLFRSGSRFYLQHKFAEAIGPYQEALGLEKHDAKLDKITWRVLVDNLGIAYGLTGDLKQAKETFEYGLSKDPTYSMFHYNLACTYAEMDDLDNTVLSLRNAYNYKAHVNLNEGMPDPQSDPSFQKFMKNDKFLKFLASLTAPRA